MPPKASYTKDEVLEAAVETVRRHGKDSLTARNIAKQLGGSTQLIYSSFPSIKELEDAAAQRALSRAIGYMQKENDPHSRFLSIGLGYLRFAREEPNLFDFLVMEKRKPWFITGSESPLYQLIQKMRQDWYFANIPDKVLKKLFNDMFIYTHGLCTLKTIRKIESNLQEERDYLQDMGGKLIAMTMLEVKQKKSLEEIIQDIFCKK
ncbi:MAG: TetR/AcrR family transcriptional regulator [Spirochaetia bacterium]